MVKNATVSARIDENVKNRARQGKPVNEVFDAIEEKHAQRKHSSVSSKSSAIDIKAPSRINHYPATPSFQPE